MFLCGKDNKITGGLWNEQDWINEYGRKECYPKDSEKALNAFIESVEEGLAKGEKFS